MHNKNMKLPFVRRYLLSLFSNYSVLCVDRLRIPFSLTWNCLCFWTENQRKS